MQKSETAKVIADIADEAARLDGFYSGLFEALGNAARTVRNRYGEQERQELQRHKELMVWGGGERDLKTYVTDPSLRHFDSGSPYRTGLPCHG